MEWHLNIYAGLNLDAGLSHWARSKRGESAFDALQELRLLIIVAVLFATSVNRKFPKNKLKAFQKYIFKFLVHWTLISFRIRWLEGLRQPVLPSERNLPSHQRYTRRPHGLAILQVHLRRSFCSRRTHSRSWLQVHTTLLSLVLIIHISLRSKK